MEKGYIKDWVWIESELNPADWVTKPRKVKELVAKGFWQNGPDFLRTDYESWPIKKSFKTRRLEGELDPKGAASSTFMVTSNGDLDKLVKRCGCLQKCHCVLAHILRWRSVETMRKGKIPLSADELRESKQFFVRWLQSGMVKELLNSV